MSKKLEQDLKPKEIKPSIVSQHCVVYKFSCDLCDSDYVGYTARHLHQRIAEHKYSAIGKHLLDVHGDKNLLREVVKTTTLEQDPPNHKIDGGVCLHPPCLTSKDGVFLA